MKSKITILLITALYILVYFNRVDDWRKDVKAFQWDKSTYYIYLPAVFIYNDLGNFFVLRCYERKV